MKITENVKIALKSLLSLKLGELATDKATLIWDGADELAEGVEVFVKDENDEIVAAPDGDYVAGDKTITVDGGKVTAIVEKAEEEPVVEEPKAEEEPVALEDEPKPADEPEVEEPKEEEVVDDLAAKYVEVLDALNVAVNAIASLEARVAELEGKMAAVEAPAADPIEEKPVVEETEHKTKMSYLRRK